MRWEEVVLRLVLALVVGGTIGAERERGDRPAGFRTHTMVCVGSVSYTHLTLPTKRIV